MLYPYTTRNACVLSILLSFLAFIGCSAKVNQPSTQTLKSKAAHYPAEPHQPMGMPVPVSQPHIGVLLPSKGPHAAAAKVIKEGFLAAHYSQAQPENTPKVTFYDTGDGQTIRAAYAKALEEHITFMVGPLTKSEVQTMTTMPLNIPVLALNTIAEGISLPQNLYQFGLMPEDEALAVAEHAIGQGHSKALILAPNTAWGHRLTKVFQEIWTSRGGRMVDMRFFKPGQESDAIRALLRVKGTTRRQDADMLFLAAPNPETARQIKPLLNFYFGETLPVFSTSAIYNGTLLPIQDKDLNGVRFCDMPWVLQHSVSAQATHERLEKLWHSVTHSPRYFALGMDAYQLAITLGDSSRSHTRTFEGFTGDLQVNAYHRVQRKLICVKFENGIPVLD